MTLAILAIPTSRGSQLCWLTAAGAARAKLNIMQAF
jgi:hypothetical protein